MSCSSLNWLTSQRFKLRSRSCVWPESHSFPLLKIPDQCSKSTQNNTAQPSHAKNDYRFQDQLFKWKLPAANLLLVDAQRCFKIYLSETIMIMITISSTRRRVWLASDDSFAKRKDASAQLFSDGEWLIWKFYVFFKRFKKRRTSSPFLTSSGMDGVINEDNNLWQRLNPRCSSTFH